jgi:hypothetical protein
VNAIVVPAWNVFAVFVAAVFARFGWELGGWVVARLF